MGYVVGRCILDPDRVSVATAFLRGELAKAEEIFRRYGLSIDDRDLGAKLAALIPDVMARNIKEELDVFSGTFPLQTRLSRNLWQLFADPNLRALLLTLLGSDKLFMHMAPTARFVPRGYSHAAVPPHRDVTYNGHMTKFVTVWKPFVEIDALCGGVRIFRDSAKDAQGAEATVQKDPTGFWYRPEDF
jgi:hypothetical protein